MILVSFCFYITAYAQSTKYIITGTDISLSIPDDFEVFTRGNIANNAYLESLGYTQSEYLSMMKQKNIYMEAAKLDENYTIVLTVIETTGDDFVNLSNSEKKSLIGDTKSTFSKSGISIDKSNFAEINDNTYLVLEYLRRSENNIIDVFCTQYSTTVNGYTYNISVDSFGQKLSRENKSEIQSIIETVEFRTLNNGAEKKITASYAPTTESVVGGVIGIILWALIPGFIARKKNRSFIAYFLLSFLITPLVSMIITFFLNKKEGNSQPVDIFEENVKKGIERRKKLFDGQNPKDPRFGYDLNKPICLSTIKSSDRYLERLRLIGSDTPFRWKRWGSICTDVYGVKDMPVDKYILVNDDKPNDEFIIYICPYGHDSDFVPKGMRLVENCQKECDEEKTEEVHVDPTEEITTDCQKAVDATRVSTSTTNKKVAIKVKVKNRSPKENLCYNCGSKLLGYEAYCRKCGIKLEKEDKNDLS